MKTLVEVIWMDAAAGCTPKDEFKSSEDLLIEQKTYGRVYDIDDKATTICTSETKYDFDYVVIPNAWIKMQTYHHKDGNLYLIVRNNGETIEERAKGSAYRQGGKSMPNIKKICRMLGSDYKLKGFPDHTRACLMLPLVKKA